MSVKTGEDQYRLAQHGLILCKSVDTLYITESLGRSVANVTLQFGAGGDDELLTFASNLDMGLQLMHQAFLLDPVPGCLTGLC